MAQQSAFDRDSIKLQPLAPVGLLEQFNLPPKMIAFIRRNQRAIWGVVVGITVVALSVSAFTAYRDHRAAKAASALDAALTAKEEKRPLLEQVVKEYGSTPSGLWASIELAWLDEREGQQAKAIVRLEEIRAGRGMQSLLAPLMLSKLAGLYEHEKQFDKALATYNELAAMNGFAAEAHRAMGRVNEQLGRNAEAAAMYGKYLELTGAQAGPANADPMREIVQSRLNQLKR